MKYKISNLMRYLALGVGFGLLLWGTGCQQQETSSAEQPEATGSSGTVPAEKGDKGDKEKQMQREQTGVLGEVGEPLSEDGWVTGEDTFTELAALDISISNGTLTVKRGELEPGEVRLSWTIKPSDGLRAADPNDVLISSSVNGGLLAVADEYTGPKNRNSPSVHMVATVGEKIAAAASLGNGDLVLNCNRIKAADCGNGTIKLAGELTADADVSLGNGKLTATLLVADGRHELNTGNGEINLTAQAGSNFNFTADAGVGSVRLSGQNVRETGRDWGLVGGEVRGAVGDGGGRVQISVGNGTIKVTGE